LSDSIAISRNTVSSEGFAYPAGRHPGAGRINYYSIVAVEAKKKRGSGPFMQF
jgi:hypothetical protein